MELILLILGSGLTLLGGYFANRHQFRLNQASEVAKLRRDKLEQLAALSITFDDWIEEMKANTFAIPPRYTKGEPSDTMYMLAALYFPTLWSPTHEVCNAARKVCQLIREESIYRTKHSERSDEFSSKYLELAKTFNEKRQDLIETLGELAKQINI